MNKPLMPKATAVWLVDNTRLTFDQIADFCGLHPLEVKGIADGDVAQGIKGLDPVSTGQVTRDDLTKAEGDATYRLRLIPNSIVAAAEKGPRKGPRYTPVARRQDRPDAIYWLLRNHPEVTDAQISKLVGTTKSTIDSVRNRTHWNSANLKAVDPVTLALCSQIELDMAVEKAARAKARATAPKRPRKTLKPASETIAANEEADAPDEAEAEVQAPAQAEAATGDE